MSRTACIDHQRKGNRDGYVQILWGGRYQLAHRVAYCIAQGIPVEEIAGLVVRHRCDNPRCVNPEHLEIGTQADNIDDMVRRGRQARGVANGLAKLTPETVRAIRARYTPGSKGGRGVTSATSVRGLAREHGVDTTVIRKIIQGKTWGHVS